MATELTVFDSIDSSNIPRRDKSAIRRWAEDMGVTQTQRPAPRSLPSRGLSIVKAARETGEVGVTAGILAYLHTELKTGLDVGRLPIDGAASGALNVASVLWPDSEVSDDVRTIANSAASVFLFRKFYDLLAEKKMAKGGTVGGTFGPKQSSQSKVNGEEDPILSTAKQL